MKTDNILMKILFSLFFTLSIVHYVESQNNSLSKKDSLLAEKLIGYADHFDRLDNKKESGNFLDKAAFLYWKYDNLKTAEKYYLRSLENYKSIDEKSKIASVSINLALIYSDLKDYNKSMSYFEEAININEGLKKDKILVYNYKNKGIAYTKLKDYDSAISCYFKALNKAMRVNDHRSVNECYGLIAEAYKKTGDNEKATFYSNQYNPDGVTNTNNNSDNTNSNNSNNNTNSNNLYSNNDNTSSNNSSNNNNTNSDTEAGNSYNSNSENNYTENTDITNNTGYNQAVENSNINDENTIENNSDSLLAEAEKEEIINTENKEETKKTPNRLVVHLKNYKGMLIVAGTLAVLILLGLFVMKIKDKKVEKPKIKVSKNPKSNKNVKIPEKKATTPPINVAGNKKEENPIAVNKKETPKKNSTEKVIVNPPKITTNIFDIKKSEVQLLASLPKSFLISTKQIFEASFFIATQIGETTQIVVAQNNKALKPESKKLISNFFSENKEIRPERVMKNFSKYIKSNNIADADLNLGISSINAKTKIVKFASAGSSFVAMQNNTPKIIQGAKSSVNVKTSQRFKTTKISSKVGYRFYMYNQSFTDLLKAGNKKITIEAVLKSIHRKSIFEQKKLLNNRINAKNTDEALFVGFAV